MKPWKHLPYFAINAKEPYEMAYGAKVIRRLRERLRANLGRNTSWERNTFMRTENSAHFL
jgi:hypothetical protein